MKIRPEKIFVYCALIFGLLFVTIIPAFQSPDEDSHFKKAYVMAQGKIFPKSENGILGYDLPKELLAQINKYFLMSGDRDKKYSYSELALDDRVPVNSSEIVFNNFSTVEVSPLVYIAPAIGIVFAKVTTWVIGLKNISIIVMMHFARTFSLLLYIVLVYYAIKTTPVLKKTFCLIGLLPMSIVLASTVTYDSVLIACSMLATAIIFKLIFDKNVKSVTYKDCVVLGIIAGILLLVKTVYIVVLLPLIFVPKEKYEGKGKLLKCYGVIFAIIFGIYLTNKIPLMFLERANVENNVGKQLSYIISNPFKYLKTMIKTMIRGRNFYITGMIGTFGLLDTYIPSVYIVLYIFSAFAVVLSDFSLSKEKFNWKYKVMAFITTGATVCAIFTALYVLWTSMEQGVGSGEITGVQGRYFIPLIPLGMVVLSNSFLEKNERIKNIMTKILTNSYLVPIMALCVTLLTLFERFWC